LTIISEISQTIGISEKELIEKGLESFIEKEIRLVARDMEDYIVWKNKEIYLRNQFYWRESISAQQTTNLFYRR